MSIPTQVGTADVSDLAFDQPTPSPMRLGDLPAGCAVWWPGAIGVVAYVLGPTPSGNLNIEFATAVVAKGLTAFGDTLARPLTAEECAALFTAAMEAWAPADAESVAADRVRQLAGQTVEAALGAYAEAPLDGTLFLAYLAAYDAEDRAIEVQAAAWLHTARLYRATLLAQHATRVAHTTSISQNGAVHTSGSDESEDQI